MPGMEDDTRLDDRRSRWTPTGFLPDTGAVPDPDSAADPDAAPEPDAPPGAVDPWLGRVFDDRFELVEAIGQGGMATVYRARESGLLSREVAIKLLSRESSQDPSVAARFRREAQLITDIHHPHVVNVFHVGRAYGQLFIVMELLRGQSLQATLHTHRVLPWSRLAAMMLNVCAALQAAHEYKVIHRDIKPSNCFRVDAAGNPDFIKVLDFGIAKAKQLPLDEGTRQGTFLGTPHYAAPEIIDPHGGPIDGRVDMYALGVVMYQCLTGSLPYTGARGFEALHHTVHSRPQPPRARAPLADIPTAVDTLVMRTLARHPEDRFADMAALADAIRETTGPRGRPPESRTGIIEDPPRHHPARKAPATTPDTPPDDPGADATPPPQAQLTDTDATTLSDGSRPSLSAATNARPVLATFGVMGIGALLLVALLAFEAWTSDPTEPSPTAPPLPPALPVAPLPPNNHHDTDTNTDTGIATDPDPTTGTATTLDTTATTEPTADPDALAREQRRQAILAALKELPLAQFAVRCNIGLQDAWTLRVHLRVAPDGSVANVHAPSRALSRPIRRCLSELLRAQHFVRGDTSIDMTYTLKGGP